jgi:hypothetical protein
VSILEKKLYKIKEFAEHKKRGKKETNKKE